MTESNQWFGKTPDGWQIKRVKDIFRLVTEQAPANHDYELLSLFTSIGVRPRKDMEERGNKAVNTDAYWRVKKGDIVVNKLLAWMGAIGLSEYEGVTSPAYDILRKKDKRADARYFTYLFRTELAQGIFKRHSRGIMDVRLRLYFDKFGALDIPCPNQSEQKAIADYLDKQTSLLDRKIILLNNKIEKYQELKKALANAVICRGLNPASKMIDSEILWLGSFPKHWHLKRVKDIAFLQSGVSIEADEFIDEGKYPVFGGNGLRGYTGNYTNDGNFVLIGRQGALCGNINYASGKFWATEHAVIVYQSKGINVFWLGELLRVMNLNQYSLSAAQPGLAVDKIKNLMIPVPSEKEQEEIAAYLDERTGRIDAIVAKLKEQVEKLQELRKTLIQDVVTGKIRVVDGVRA